MGKNKLSMNVVLIADRIKSFEDVDLASNDLELIEDSYFDDLFESLSNLFRKVHVYESPMKFLSSIANHKQDFVFSIWSGKNSRNRRALVPSICEAYNIPYLGADTYTNILCQDK